MHESAGLSDDAAVEAVGQLQDALAVRRAESADGDPGRMRDDLGDVVRTNDVGEEYLGLHFGAVLLDSLHHRLPAPLELGAHLSGDVATTRR